MLAEAALRVASPIFALALVLMTSGLWLVCALVLIRSEQRRKAGFVVLGFSLTAMALAIIATSDLLLPAWIEIDNGKFLIEALPYFAASGSALLLAALIIASARRGWTTAFLVLLIVPIIALFVVRNSSPMASRLAGTAGTTLAYGHPSEPIVSPRYVDMVYIPSGPFIRGSLDPYQLQTPVGNEYGDEQPVRSIYLDGFFIERTAVSNSQFAEFVDATGHVTDAEKSRGGILIEGDEFVYVQDTSWRSPAGGGQTLDGLWDHPVVHVSWFDAAAYCDWNGRELPTEAQREKAARGTDGRIYPWGNEFDPSRVNFCDAECPLTDRIELPVSDGYARTSPVDAFPSGASPYGVLDMAGNVWEWTNDWYDAEYYSYSAGVNPRGPVRAQSSNRNKIVRGGAWTSLVRELRTSSKSYDPPRDWRSFGVGFRCVVNEVDSALDGFRPF